MIEIATEALHRFMAWCGTCQDTTESDDPTRSHCLQCGDPRADVGGEL